MNQAGLSMMINGSVQSRHTDTEAMVLDTLRETRGLTDSKKGLRHIETPPHLIDVNHIGDGGIEETADGGLKIGANVRNADFAAEPRVRERYEVLSRALLSGAAAQLRKKANTARSVLKKCTVIISTHDESLQQARSRFRLRRSAMFQPYPRHSRRQRALHRHPPFDKVIDGLDKQ